MGDDRVFIFLLYTLHCISSQVSPQETHIYIYTIENNCEQMKYLENSYKKYFHAAFADLKQFKPLN